MDFKTICKPSVEYYIILHETFYFHVVLSNGKATRCPRAKNKGKKNNDKTIAKMKGKM